MSPHTTEVMCQGIEGKRSYEVYKKSFIQEPITNLNKKNCDKICTKSYEIKSQLV